MFNTGSPYVGSVDGGRPPECEATVGDLVETGSLGIGQLLPFHGLLKTAGLLPETKHARPLETRCPLWVITIPLLQGFVKHLIAIGQLQHSTVLLLNSRPLL